MEMEKQNISDFLQKIDCGEFVEVFESNNISVESLPTLLSENEVLKELLPKIGDRLTFISKYKKFLPQSLSIDTEDANPVIFTVHNDGTLINIEQATSYADTKLISSESSSDTGDELMVPISEHRTISFHSENDMFHNEDMPEINLKELLSKAPMGKNIINYYSRHNILSTSLRNRLVDIIFTKLFDFHCKHRLTHKNYLAILEQIHLMFPKEPCGIYYTAAVRKADAGKCVLAKGKLLHKAKNLIHLGGYARPTRKRKHEFTQDPENNNENIKKLESGKYLSKFMLQRFLHLAYVKQRTLGRGLKPLEEYPRTKKTLSSCYTVAEFSVKWPIIKDLRSYSLIDYDFEQKFPEQGLNLLKNWDVFFNKILDIRDSSRAYITENEETDVVELDRNSKISKQIFLLGKILPPKGRIMQQKKHWKFSTQECVDSIIVQANSAADIIEKINLQKERAKARSLTLQPFLLVEGDNKEQIKNSYVVVDEIRYQFDDTLRAFDILFKIFFALNICYPPQAEHIYELLEVGIFKSQRKDLKYIHHFEDILKDKPSD